MSYLSENRSQFVVGDRVRISPSCDLYMRGERYAEIVTVGTKWVHVKGERSGKTFKMNPANVWVPESRLSESVDN